MARLDLTGDRYGRLTVLEEVAQHKTKRRWRCLCDCGNETIALMDSLRSGNTQSCGCLRSEKAKNNADDIAGKRFGKLTVIKRADKNDNYHAFWECLCDCGNNTVVDASNLKSGITKSCGCMGPEIRITKEQCLNDLMIIYKMHNRKVTNNKLDDLLPYSVLTLKRRFDGQTMKQIWNEVMREITNEHT